LKVSRKRVCAILQALLVTFLWSTSWVLIKIDLRNNLPPVTFAGLRYTLSFVILMPFVIGSQRHRRAIRTLTSATWIRLCLLGLTFYTMTQGAQFIGLSLLPAATLSLVLNLTPVVVAAFSGIINRESLSPLQWGGVMLTAMGVLFYFLPLTSRATRMIGIFVALIGLGANSASSLLGRRVNRSADLSPLIVTFISMGVGGTLLLASGTIIQGFGRLGLIQWFIVTWLAVVNTAFAFTLWNHTLQRLTAVESSIVNGAMLPQIATMSWLFLGESLRIGQIVALALVVVGTVAVQVAPRG
jgi:drug/metabolite transporter (DMT)-like permease